MRSTIFVLLAASVSCIVQAPPAEPQPGAQGQAQGQPQAAEGQGYAPGQQAGGTCDGACAHYLECKGAVDPVSQASCVQQCQGLSPTPSPQDFANYLTLDCPTAIAVVENGQGYGAGGQTPSAQPAGGSQCNGCAWDGTECVWASQSDWGQGGPYSGAVSSCDPSCCGH